MSLNIVVIFGSVRSERQGIKRPSVDTSQQGRDQAREAGARLLEARERWCRRMYHDLNTAWNTRHLIPGANRGAVDRLDHAPTQPDATQAQPEAISAASGDQPKSFVWCGEPHRNRTRHREAAQLS